MNNPCNLGKQKTKGVRVYPILTSPDKPRERKPLGKSQLDEQKRFSLASAWLKGKI